MKCPLCGGTLDTIDSRAVKGVGPITGIVKRRRECIDCLTRYPTVERIDFEKLPKYIKDKLHDKVRRDSDEKK